VADTGAGRERKISAPGNKNAPPRRERLAWQGPILPRRKAPRRRNPLERVGGGDLDLIAELRAGDREVEAGDAAAVGHVGRVPHCLADADHLAAKDIQLVDEHGDEGPLFVEPIDEGLREWMLLEAQPGVVRGLRPVELVLIVSASDCCCAVASGRNVSVEFVGWATLGKMVASGIPAETICSERRSSIDEVS